MPPVSLPLSPAPLEKRECVATGTFTCYVPMYSHSLTYLEANDRSKRFLEHVETTRRRIIVDISTIDTYIILVKTTNAGSL